MSYAISIVCMYVCYVYIKRSINKINQSNFVADFLQAKCDFVAVIGSFAFLKPPLWDLGATYDDHLTLNGKRVVDFLLVLIELFSPGVTAEALRANIGRKIGDFVQRRSVDPQFHVEEAAPTNHSSSQKTRLNDLSYGIKIWTDLSSISSQSTQTDGQTDGRTDKQNSHR